MADTKLSALPESTAPALTDEVYINNAGTSKKVALTNLVTPVGLMSHVRAHRETAQSIPNNTDTRVIFNVEDLDALNEYVHTTGIFTATYTGIYAVSAYLLYTTATWPSGTANKIRILIEDVVYATGTRRQFHENTDEYCFLSVVTTVPLVAGETLDIFTNHEQGGAVDLLASPTANYLTIDRLP